MWRLVMDAHMPLTEIDRWDLEDIRKANAIMDMRQSYDAAVDAWEAEQYKRSRGD